MSLRLLFSTKNYGETPTFLISIPRLAPKVSTDITKIVIEIHIKSVTTFKLRPMINSAKPIVKRI